MSFLADFRSDLEASGIKSGDTVVVGSNVRQLILRMMFEDRNSGEALKQAEYYLDRVINMFQELVGDQGTLMFHTFYWAFCHGKPFDYNLSASETGILSNRALERDDFIRTQHPIYSFAVWGKGASFLSRMQNTKAFDVGSPFEYMHETNAACINIDVPAFSFVHYVEQKIGVEYRFEKNFTGKYIKDGVATERTYSMLVRYLCLNVRTLPFWDDYLDSCCLQNITTSKVKSQVIRCVPAYDQLAYDITQNDAKNIVSYDREKAERHMQYED